MGRKHRKLITWLMTIVMIYSPSIIYAQQGISDTTDKNKRTSTKAKTSSTAPKGSASSTKASAAKGKAAADEDDSAANTKGNQPPTNKKSASTEEVSATSEEQSEATPKEKIALGDITPNAMAAVVLYPRSALTSPEMEFMPQEVLSAASLKEWGIDPLQIEQVVATAELPQEGPPQARLPQAAIVLHLASPLKQKEIIPPIWENTTEATLNGKKYRKANMPMAMSIFYPDDHTVIIAHELMLPKVLANQAEPKEGRISKMLERLTNPPDVSAIVLVEPLRPLITMPLAMAPIPPAYEDAKKIPGLLASIGVKINLTGKTGFSLALKANDDAAADELEKILDTLLTNGREQLIEQFNNNARSGDEIQQASAQYGKRLATKMSKALRPVRKGQSFTLATNDETSSKLISVSTIGILASMLLPAVQGARAGARRAQSMNNMKQILLAMLNCESATKAFPPRANFTKDGKPLLSWRVQILPYIEQNNLYQQFHLDEPWDSEHNKALIPLMPPVYSSPSCTNMQPGMTNYMGVVGKGMAFEGDKGRTLADFKDGTSNAILLVEVSPNKACEWTKPDDWEYNPNDPFAGLLAMPGSFNMGFADGSVHQVSPTVDPKMFHSLLTIDGGESVDTNSF
jgi:prepilin-type processing-associated H-X9-DG protein